MEHRVAPRAVDDLDDIWYYVARQSGNIDVATRLIDSLTDRFFLLANNPLLGRARDDLGAGTRGFPVGEYVIVYRVADAVSILRVVHGRRQMERLFET